MWGEPPSLNRIFGITENNPATFPEISNVSFLFEPKIGLDPYFNRKDIWNCLRQMENNHLYYYKG